MIIWFDLVLYFDRLCFEILEILNKFKKCNNIIDCIICEPLFYLID